jgi:hypothetical protein
MKYNKTILALGIAGAFGWSAASATTFLCVTDPSDISFKACAEVAPDAFGSSQPADSLALSDPGFVKYSSIEYRDDSASADFMIVPEQSLAAYDSLELASEEVASSDVWLYSDPMVVTYFYTFDSAGAD